MDVLISHYQRKPGLGIWAVEIKGARVFIGASGLVYYDNTTDIEVGYRFLKEYWNQGYATEAAKLLDYGFRKLKLQKIVCSAHVENWPSRRVMERIGMQFIDTRFNYGCTQAYYEILCNEFESQEIANAR